MTLAIIIGAWALVFGHMSLNGSMKMKANEARIFGALLIVFASYGLPIIFGVLHKHLPGFVLGNEGLKSAVDMVIGAFAAYGAGWVTLNVVPKLRIPNITVSMKRIRA